MRVCQILGQCAGDKLLGKNLLADGKLEILYAVVHSLQIGDHFIYVVKRYAHARKPAPVLLMAVLKQDGVDQLSDKRACKVGGLILVDAVLHFLGNLLSQFPVEGSPREPATGLSCRD